MREMRHWCSLKRVNILVGQLQQQYINHRLGRAPYASRDKFYDKQSEIHLNLKLTTKIFQKVYRLY